LRIRYQGVIQSANMSEQTAAPTPTSIMGNDDPLLCKVVVTNMKRGTTAEALKAWLIEKSGIDAAAFLKCDVSTPKNEEKKTDMAKIEFSSTPATDTALEGVMKLEGKDRQLDEFTINMRRDIPQFIWDNPKMKPHAFATSKKLFVSGLPKAGCNWEDELRSLIDPLLDTDEKKILGTIEEYRVIMEKDPKTMERLDTCKGYAFIHTTSEQLADKLAIQLACGFKIGGRDAWVKKDDSLSKKGGERGGRGGMRGRGMGRGGRGGYQQQQWGWGPAQQQGYHGYGQDGYGQGGWGYEGGYDTGYQGGYQGYGSGYGGYGGRGGQRGRGGHF